MKSISICRTVLGRIAVAEDGQAITNLYLPGADRPAGAIMQRTDLLKEAERQLKSYLAGKRKDFDLLLAPEGTDFMKAVWRTLQAIPYGETRSYGEIAEVLKRPGAFRAVGEACRRNPVAIFIPCHRVIGWDGSLTGYQGGLQIKKNLLELEGASWRN